MQFGHVGGKTRQAFANAADALKEGGRGNTSRTVEFEAKKIIASRYDLSPSAADVLKEPIVVCRATGTTVIPKEHSRKNPDA